MTEISYFWDHGTGGHASDSPYSDQEFQKIFGMLATFAPQSQGIIQTWGNAFSCIVTGQTIRVRSGRAIVANALYQSDEERYFSVNVPASGVYFYYIVLRKDMGAKTVRQKMLGPGINAYPPITQSDLVWDLPIVGISVVSDGNVSANPIRANFIHPDGSEYFPVIARQGGSATSWSVQGTTQRAVALESAMQTGIAPWSGSATSGSVVVTFPYAFDDTPIVFVGSPNNSQDQSVEWGDIKMITAVSDITASGFTLHWRSIGGIAQTTLELTWMAIGPRAVR